MALHNACCVRRAITAAIAMQHISSAWQINVLGLRRLSSRFCASRQRHDGMARGSLLPTTAAFRLFNMRFIANYIKRFAGI